MLSRQVLYKQLKTLALFAGASCVQALFMCSRCGFMDYARVALFTFFLWIFLFQGNQALAHYVSSRISWVKFPLRRFLVGLFATLGYTFLAVLLVMVMFERFASFNFGSSFRFTIIVSVGFTVIISLFLHTREFLLHWRRATSELERFQQESVTARYESLKNRVNPQFLFKSLQALRGMIPADKEGSVKFIKYLSNVYRYILETREQEIVDHRQEIRFLQSFLYLIERRYNSMIKVHLDLGNEGFYISPLALQMIIESVVDGANIDPKAGLKLDVLRDSEYIVVKSDVDWCDDSAKLKAQQVLDNIRERYSLLVQAPLIYNLQDNMFICHLPVIVKPMVEE